MADPNSCQRAAAKPANVTYVVLARASFMIAPGETKSRKITARGDP
jgi:hypothetical protein